MMSDYIKKAGVLLGHAICIFILLYSFATNRETVKGEEIQVTEQMQQVTEISKITVAPVLTITVIPTETPTPEPTSTPIPTETNTPVPTVGPEEARTEVKNKVLQNISEDIYTASDNKRASWWFRRKTGHVQSGSGESFKIAEYQGYYLNTKASEENKVIYLTLDCGYGSSNTPIILDIFKKHDIKVTFFVTGNYLKACPEYVKRMVDEGHAVANHSVSHADLTELTDEEIYKEIIGCEELFHEITGTQMAPYFRPPEGAYSKRTMQITKDLGYKTVFWSIAYNDYDKKNQPGKQYVLDHVADYHHNGAVLLMHNDSDSNMEAMSEVVSLLKEQGYRFGTLDELN